MKDNAICLESASTEWSFGCDGEEVACIWCCSSFLPLLAWIFSFLLILGFFPKLVIYDEAQIFFIHQETAVYVFIPFPSSSLTFPASQAYPVLFPSPMFPQAILSSWCTLSSLFLSEGLPILQCYFQRSLKNPFPAEWEYTGIYKEKSPLYFSVICVHPVASCSTVNIFKAETLCV